MNLPITPAQLRKLQHGYRVFDRQGRLGAGCRTCGTVFIVSPARLPGANLAGLYGHADDHAHGRPHARMPGDGAWVALADHER